MNALTFMICLIFIGTWIVTDGIFSVCCYPQEAWRQHWVRVARILWGFTVIWLGYYFGAQML